VLPTSSSPNISRTTDVVVVGAGVLGLCVAAELTRRGHEVVVVDPGGLNASAVAAGMIAPALESAVENEPLERAELLRRAAALWPEFAEATGVELHENGAVWMGAGVEEIEERLVRLGFETRREGGRLIIAGERRVEAEAALLALADYLKTDPVVSEARGVERLADGWRVHLADGEIEAASVVIATGAAPALAGLPQDVADAIRAIQPIGGLVGKTRALFDPGVIRGRGAYAATGPAGTVIGATMDFDQRTAEPDPERGRALLDALSVYSGLATPAADVEWRAGVRGAVPDGLPLAGAVRERGLFFALAPRRNGWLLGPLVGRTVADAIEGATPQPDAAALDPLRASTP
jgi:glycine oxidase